MSAGCVGRQTTQPACPSSLSPPTHIYNMPPSPPPPSPVPLSGPLPVDPLPASLTPRRATCAYFSSICRTSAVTKWRRARASCFAAGKYCRALMFNPRGEGHDGTARRGNRADDSAYRARPPCVPPPRAHRRRVSISRAPLHHKASFSKQ